MRHAQLTALLAATLLGSSLLLTACGGGSGPSRLETATGSVDDLRNALDVGAEEVEDVMVAIQDLTRTEDMKSAFKSYSKSLDQLEKAADRARARRIAMETRIEDHIAKWGEQLEGISNEEMRQISNQRMEQLRSALEGVVAELDDLKGQYEPFISNLRDIELVLANDLSRGGIQVARPLINDAVTQAQDVNKAIGEVNVALDKAISAFRQ